MQTNLKWKKGVFSNLYKIYSNGEQIGNLSNKTLSQSGIGVIDKKEYLFQTKGFFKQKIQIIDTTVNKTVGEINFKNWRTKATITINDKTINWKSDNLWNTKWSIFNSEGINIKYSGSSTGGQIDSNIDNSLLLLSGLFVINYYWQKTIAALIPVFFLIWTTMN
jgi:hypothetical protein